jgi:hypothetical protein
MGSSIDCWMRARYESARLALTALKPKSKTQLRLLPQLENKSGYRPSSLSSGDLSNG